MPTQSWAAAHQQWGEGTNDGFVTSAQAALADAADKAARTDTGVDPVAAGMGYWSEDDLPFYYGLARTFPLADHWFSSCLGPTFPNRRFLIAGTAHGLIDDSPYDLLDYPPAGTIFDMLTRYGISWANYHPVAAARARTTPTPGTAEDDPAPAGTRRARRERQASRRISSSRPTSSRSE